MNDSCEKLVHGFLHRLRDRPDSRRKKRKVAHCSVRSDNLRLRSSQRSRAASRPTNTVNNYTSYCCNLFKRINKRRKSFIVTKIQKMREINYHDNG